MRFWDTSALLPLAVNEQTSFKIRMLAASDRDLLVAFITPLEMEAALLRRMRGSPPDARSRSWRRIDVFSSRWLIVAGAERTMERALAIVGRYTLRAADAIQLAAAMIARERGMSFDFITLDLELATAARAEGFRVLPELSLP